MKGSWGKSARDSWRKKEKRERHKLGFKDMINKIRGKNNEGCMKPVFSFSKSVLGDLHKLKKKPCQDYSASFDEENEKYHIAIVADGHGSAECFRSAFGSKTAVEVALNTLKSFADEILEKADLEKKFYDDIFSNSLYRKGLIRQQTDTIIREWKSRVEADFKNNPPTEEELLKAELSEKTNLNIPHIYGTTLIAALWLPECLIVVHQGDGRCVVFYDDGTVDQPVPWDDRCIGTAVTSMCDTDAEGRIRHYVLNFNDKKAIACYLGSDGVEDAYRDTYDEKGKFCMGDMGGVYTFYKYLTCEIIEQGQCQIEPFLEQMLLKFSAEGLFSRTGSGDDVSVAGIVNVEVVQKYCKQFKQDIQVYDLKEKLFWKEDELRGKTRKHGILLKRMNDSKGETLKAQEDIAKIEKALETCLDTRSELENNIQKAKLDIQEFDKAYAESETKLNSGLYDEFLRTIRMDKFTADYKRKKERDLLQNQLNNLIEKQNKCVEKLDNLQRNKDSTVDSLRQFEDKLAEAKKKFEEYDENYQRIENECKQLQNEIDKVLNQ